MRYTKIVLYIGKMVNRGLKEYKTNAFFKKVDAFH